MSPKLYRELAESIKETGRIRRGKAKPSRVFTYDAIDIRKLRESVDVSQAQFARMIGVSKDTVQNWEQGRATPEDRPAPSCASSKKTPKPSYAPWADSVVMPRDTALASRSNK